MAVEKLQLSGGDLINLIRIKHGYIILVRTEVLDNVRITKTEALKSIMPRNDYQVSLSDEKQYIGIWARMLGEKDRELDKRRELAKRRG